MRVYESQQQIFIQYIKIYNLAFKNICMQIVSCSLNYSNGKNIKCIRIASNLIVVCYAKTSQKVSNNMKHNLVECKNF